MSLVCKMFGHAPLTKAGWHGGVGYAKVVSAPVDGLGCVHLHMEAECPRCGTHYRIANVHVPELLTRRNGGGAT